MADSVFERRKIIFKRIFAEFINGFSVADDISAVIHVDLSKAMVHVANLLRFRDWDGNFYIFSEREGNFTVGGDNFCAEFIFFAYSAGRMDILLSNVALLIAGVAYGDLFN